jgi:integrase
MSLRKRNGQWWYRIFIGGREVESRTTGLVAANSNRKRALEIHDKRKKELLESRKAVPANEALFAEAAGEFNRWAEVVEYRSKPNTSRRIRTSFASLVEFLGNERVSEITPAHLERFKAWRVEEHGVRDITIRHDLHAFSLFCKYARKAHWLEGDPMLGVKIPSDRDATRQHVVTSDEEERYFKAASKNRNLYDVARLILLQGCRPEEIMSLKPEHVSIGSATMTIAGGKSPAARRTLDLCGESDEILRRRLIPNAKWLFPSALRPGQHLAKLQGAHDKACREAGVSFVLYDLRHTFATRLADAGEPLATIAALLGHSSLRVLHRYVHPSAESKRDVMKRYDAARKPRLKVVG